MEEKEDEIVVLKYFDHAIEANIAKTKLDAYGVPCFLTEENMANLYPGQSLYAFKIRLHLFASDRERAMQILGSENLSIRQEGLPCPRCQSTHVTRGFPKKLADSFTTIFFGVFFPQKKVNRCEECGCEF